MADACYCVSAESVAPLYFPLPGEGSHVGSMLSHLVGVCLDLAA